MSFSDKIIALGGASGFGGAWLWSDRIGGEVVAAVMVMAGTFLLGALAWRADMWSPRSAGSRVRGGLERPDVQKVGAIGLSLLIIGSAVAGPLGPSVVGTATAAFGFQDCDTSDSLVGAFMKSFTDPNADGECRFNPSDNDATAHNDAYSDGLAVQESNDIFRDTQSNHLNGQGTMAFMQAKVNISEQLENNVTSNATLTESVNTTVNESLRADAVNVLQHYSASISQAEYWWKANQSYVVADHMELRGFVTVANATIMGQDNISYRTWVFYNLNTEEYKPVMIHDPPPGKSWGGTGEYDPNVTWENAYIPKINNSTSNLEERNAAGREVVYTSPPGSGESDIEAIHSDGYSSVVKNYQSKADNMRRQASEYAREANHIYNATNVPTTEIAGPDALAAAASTNYNETGSYSYVGANLAALGYTGNLNSSITLTWNYTANGTAKSETLEGHLFYTGKDETWNVSEEINTSAKSGVYYFAAAGKGGNASLANLNGTITITEAQNPETGEELTQVKTQNYTSESNNASDLQKDLEQSAELREEYEEMQTTSGGVGCVAACGDGSSILPAETGLFVVLGLAAIILLARP